VKARPVVGGAAALARVGAIIEGATYGRDWTAADVEAIRRMRLRMEEGAKPTNLKRGPGGVVDIEFAAQMLQLVHGGREPGLRTTGTLPALVALRDCGVIDTGRFALLERSYRLLRSIEGRLRLLAAAARHDFPESDSERRTLALLLGYPDAPSLAADVHETTARVREGFTAIFDDTIRALS
jgi:glutamate-ammonia-ligase adenylyltransferase